MARIDRDIAAELLHIDGKLEELIQCVRDRRNSVVYKAELRKISNNIDIAYKAIRKAIAVTL